MAELYMKTSKILDNVRMISEYLADHDIYWTLISKVLSGHREALREILSDEVIKTTHSIGDSRLSSLATIKDLRPEIVTMYIKPPAATYADEIIEVADITFNTSLETLEALNNEAARRNKIHRSIIMIELGELREGILHENVVDFYKNVFEMDNIEIAGLGTNLGCMYGIEPTYDKLIQLSLYKQLLEAQFGRKIELISGGTSITLPLIKDERIPKTVNHFRIGEAAFLGVSPLDGKPFEGLNHDNFVYNANIVEIEEKYYIPDGNIGDAAVGHTGENTYSQGEKSYKALLDFGVLDVDDEALEADDDDIDFIGTTSDLSVYDLGDNIDSEGNQKYKVGDAIRFQPNYMGVARLMTSKFIDKKIEPVKPE